MNRPKWLRWPWRRERKFIWIDDSVPDAVAKRHLLIDSTDYELRNLAIQVAMGYDSVSYSDIREEMRYREQRRISKWVAWLIGVTLFTNLVGIAVNIWANWPD